MDIFFSDPEDVPLPPDEVRIRKLEALPYPDGRRVRVLIELTPFQKFPSGEVTIRDHLNTPVATTSFIEAITPKLEMTLHLRSVETVGEYFLNLNLFYSPEIDEEQQGDRPLMPSEKNVVDEKTVQFNVGE